jgi:molecular chaperone DnaJ
MPEDFYTILGVDQDAGIDEIKQAYRTAAKKCHPDASGTDRSAERFRALGEAYETLRDRNRRQAYDRGLKRQESAAKPPNPYFAHLHSARFAGVESRRPAEGIPLGAGMLFAGFADLAGTMAGFRSMAGLRSMAGFRFMSELPLKPPRSREPLLEVVLSPGEAMRGVHVPVEVPIVLSCPQCEASGYWERSTCAACGGAGLLRSASRVMLEIPPGVPHGVEFLCHLGSHGVDSQGFRLRVLVEPT